MSSILTNRSLYKIQGDSACPESEGGWPHRFGPDSVAPASWEIREDYMPARRPGVVLDEVVQDDRSRVPNIPFQRRLFDRTKERPRRRSRDMRGIGTDLKIMPEACSPANKGPPALDAERSVKPSAQPTLVRTQH